MGHGPPCSSRHLRSLPSDCVNRPGLVIAGPSSGERGLSVRPGPTPQPLGLRRAVGREFHYETSVHDIGRCRREVQCGSAGTCHRSYCYLLALTAPGGGNSAGLAAALTHFIDYVGLLHSAYVDHFDLA